MSFIVPFSCILLVKFDCTCLKWLFLATQGAESGPHAHSFSGRWRDKVGDVIAFKPDKNGASPRPPLSGPAKIVRFLGGRYIPLNSGSQRSGKRAPELENSAWHQRHWWNFSISFSPLWASVVAFLRTAKLRDAMCPPAPAVQPSRSPKGTVPASTKRGGLSF